MTLEVEPSVEIGSTKPGVDPAAVGRALPALLASPVGRLRLVDAVSASSVQGITVADLSAPDAPLIYVSPSFERLTGYNATDCLGRNCRFLQGPGTSPAAVARIRAGLRAGDQIREVLLNYREDGTPFWNELTLYPFTDHDGRPCALGLQHDVTHLREMDGELARARQALSERQRFTSAVLDGIHAAIVTTDADGIVTFGNRMAQSTLGLSGDELIGWPAADVLQLPPEARGCFSAQGGGQKRFSYTFQRRDGVRVDIGLSTSRPEGLSTLSTPGLGHCVIFRDLAEIKQLEMDVRRIERLAAMGTMVAGFAHEVRNPVASLRILGEALEAELELGDPRHEYLARMMHQVVRIERLVKTSLRFGCPEPPRRAVHAPTSIVTATLDAIVEKTKRRGSIRVDIARDLPAINVDDAQLVQVLVILISNALDVATSPERVVLRVRADGPRSAGGGPEGVRFEVIDDGPGIPEYMQTHVFDPFFTTKPNGTGLGLSIAQQLVHDNGGRIELSSTPGRGATFAVLVVLGE